jgi:hypothetical protein
MKTSKSTTGSQSASKKTPSKSSEEIKTDFPLSEKDEVKKAEQNLQKSQNKNG